LGISIEAYFGYRTPVLLAAAMLLLSACSGGGGNNKSAGDGGGAKTQMGQNKLPIISITAPGSNTAYGILIGIRIWNYSGISHKSGTNAITVTERATRDTLRSDSITVRLVRPEQCHGVVIQSQQLGAFPNLPPRFNSFKLQLQRRKET